MKMPTVITRTLKAMRRTQPRPPMDGNFFWWLRQSTAGEPVTPDTAMTYLAVWACIHAISDPLAWLPVQVIRQEDRRKIRLNQSLLHDLLNNRPNSEMTAFQWRQVVFYHKLLWGNHYSEIERSMDGRPIALWPIEPWRVEPKRTQDGELFYQVMNTTGGQIGLPQRDVFHLRGIGIDGIRAVSPTSVGAEAIGVGLAMDKFAASFFGNGTALSGLVTHPGQLSEAALNKLRRAWQSSYGGGASNQFQTAVLDEGVKYESIGTTPKDSQMVEQKQHQVTDICRLFKVPPHKIYELTRASFSNADQQERIFVRDTLMPEGAQFCQEVDRKLVEPRLRGINDGVVHTRFDFRELLRGDYKDFTESLEKQARMGALSVNEIRDEMGLDPLPDETGDLRFVQLNQGTLEQMAALAKQAENEAKNGDDESSDDAPPALRQVL